MKSQNIEKVPNQAFHDYNNRRLSLIIIGSEAGLFRPNSEARQRLQGYAPSFSQLHIIVFSKTSQRLPAKPVFVEPNIWLYATNSRSSWLYIWDAWRIGRLLPPVEGISAQDPFESGLVAWFLARFFKIKLQLQIHTDFLNPHFISESLLNRLRVQLASFLLPRADKIRVVSQRIVNSLKAKGDKLKAVPIILPVFVNIEKIKQMPIKTDLRKKYPQFDKIILMASRLTREKNISLAIEAMREVVKQYLQTGLIVVGSGPEESRLKLKAESSKLKTNVVFEPWTDDLISYYKTADLFINTSYYEGYGRTIVEALATGCPVLSTDVGLVNEANYQGLTVITDNNIVELINKHLVAKPPAVDISLPYSSRADYLHQYQQSWLS